MTVELLACPSPWCEAAERVGDYSPAFRLSHFGNYRVICTSCILEGPARPTKEEAIAAWNTRPSLEGVAGLVEALTSLQRAETTYRRTHDLHGDADMRTGRAWDAMRRASDRAKAALATFRDQGGR